jgi:hypothetical protein
VSTPFPLVPTPGRDLFFPPTLHFFIKCILIVQGGLALVVKVCTYGALIRLNLLPVTYPLPIIMLP